MQKLNPQRPQNCRHEFWTLDGFLTGVSFLIKFKFNEQRDILRLSKFSERFNSSQLIKGLGQILKFRVAARA